MRIEAERLCKEFPETPSRTLAKRLEAEFGVTLENARSTIRLIRGNKGNERRKDATTKRPNGKSGWKPQMPESLAEPWTPFDLDGVKRVGIISDVHIPYHSEIAFSAAVKHLKTMKPDCILLNGDFADFYSISRWQKDPRKRDFRMERGLLKQGLEWIRGEFPKARMVFKKGNHEERWDHYLWNHAPEICDMEHIQMEHWLDFEKLGIEMVEEQRPIMAGKLPVCHGHELPRGLSSPVNQARGAFMRTIHTILVGHGHRTSGHSEPDMWGDEIFCWSTGCLADLNPEYARINKWNWGFAAVDVASNGEFDVDNFRITKAGNVRSS